MEAMALNNLWQYIQGLPLTSQNKEWLAGKLLSVQDANAHINYEQLHERLEQLSALEDGWDDEGAKAICGETLNNVRQVLENTPDADLEHWLMFPAVNGTVTFQHESLDALLSIGDSSYSFVFSINEKIVKLVDCAPFSLANVVDIFEYMKGIADGKRAS